MNHNGNTTPHGQLYKHTRSHATGYVLAVTCGRCLARQLLGAAGVRAAERTLRYTGWAWRPATGYVCRRCARDAATEQEATADVS